MDKSRLERIRLLSGSFHQLQGLKTALVGAVLAIVVGSYAVAVPEPTETGFYVALVVAAALFVPGIWALDRYYATTFGRQVVSPAHGTEWRWVGLIVVLSVIGSVVDRFDPPPGTPTALVIGGTSLWVAIRDWPWRAHYLGPTAAVAISVIANVAGADSVSRNEMLALTFVLLGASFVPVGFLDHRLLVTLTEEARQPEAANAANRIDV